MRCAAIANAEAHMPLPELMFSPAPFGPTKKLKPGPNSIRSASKQRKFRSCNSVSMNQLVSLLQSRELASGLPCLHDPHCNRQARSAQLLVISRGNFVSCENMRR